MSLWRRFVRWLAREEPAAAHASLLTFVREVSVGPGFGVPGTEAALRWALSEACRNSIPACVDWSIERRVSEDLVQFQLSIVIEEPGFPGKAA